MAGLDEMRVKISENLATQNGILQKCIAQYTDSNKTVSIIADKIALITKEITDATAHLTKIGQQHEKFEQKYNSETQRFNAEKVEMVTQFNNEKEKIQRDMATKNIAAKEEEVRIRAEADTFAQQARDKQVQALDYINKEKETRQNEELKKITENLKEEQGKVTDNLKEFEEKLSNTQNEAKEKLDAMLLREGTAAQTHKEDLLKITDQGGKIVVFTNRINELETMIETMKQTIETLETEHAATLKALGEKAKKDISDLTATNIAKIHELTEINTKAEAEALTKSREETEKLVEDINRSHEIRTSAAKTEGVNELENLQKQLAACKQEKEVAEGLYSDNVQKINDLKVEFEKAEKIGMVKLENNVEKLTGENIKLQEQVTKMSIEWGSKGPPPKGGPPASPPPPPSSGSPRLRKLPPAPFEKRATPPPPRDWLGGYKHGKSSKKKNKRSLKSKLTAKKYSLKIKSQKKGKKGKTKKRRKSIKIRI